MIRITTVDKVADISFFNEGFFASSIPALKTLSTFLCTFTCLFNFFFHGTNFVAAELFRITFFINYTWFSRFCAYLIVT